jgi:hypothetical protein
MLLYIRALKLALCLENKIKNNSELEALPLAA